MKGPIIASILFLIKTKKITKSLRTLIFNPTPKLTPTLPSYSYSSSFSSLNYLHISHITQTRKKTHTHNKCTLFYQNYARISNLRYSYQLKLSSLEGGFFWYPSEFQPSPSPFQSAILRLFQRAKQKKRLVS